jgi:hypothetical protein
MELEYQSAADLWRTALETIREQVPEKHFETWF